MSNRILKEESSPQKQFDKLSGIESINGKIIHNEELSLLSNQIIDNQLSNVDIANTISSIFGESVKGTFEVYRRAGKFFFRCEHDEGKGYSQLMGNLLKILIEKNMEKTNIHYIITPKSASAVFR